MIEYHDRKPEHGASAEEIPALARFLTGRAPALSVQRIRTLDDFDTIEFTDGVAAVEAPYELLAEGVQFKNDRREESDRLDRLERSIRDRGYVPMDPIVAKIGRRGRWVVIDGGHRLTAARHVAGEFWTNLFGEKVENMYFLLFETPNSRTKALRPPEA